MGDEKLPGMFGRCFPFSVWIRLKHFLSRYILIPKYTIWLNLWCLKHTLLVKSSFSILYDLMMVIPHTTTVTTLTTEGPLSIFHCRSLWNLKTPGSWGSFNLESRWIYDKLFLCLQWLNHWLQFMIPQKYNNFQSSVLTKTIKAKN